MEFELLNVLGKDTSSPEVRSAVKKFGLFDILESPPDNRYQSANKKGLSLLIEKEQVSAIQIYLQPEKPFATYSDPLPFGIKKGMSQNEVYSLLGQPDEDSSQFRSDFSMPSKKLRLSVRFDKAGIVKLLSMDWQP